MATGRIGTNTVLTTRWSKAPAGGTTSLSGLDDNSVSLVYSVGYEQVYRNGVLLSRGNDYTATNGTTITLIDATITGDIIEVFANATIPLTDTYSQSVANGKFINNTLTTTTGDIIYASAANTPARLGIGSTDQVLKVSGGVPAWGAAASGMTVIASGSLSSTSLLISSIPSTYTDLILDIANYTTTVTGWAADLRINDDSNSNRHYTATAQVSSGTAFNDTKFLMTIDNGNVSSSSNSIIRVTIPSYANTTTWKIAQFAGLTQVSATPTSFYFAFGYGLYNQTSAISSLRILPNSAATIGGTYTLYGVK